MPALQVSIDGKIIATISANGLDLVAAEVSGSRFGAQLGDLVIRGVTPPEKGGSTCFTWSDREVLQLGEKITFSLIPAGNTHPTGKTSAELFPDSQPEARDVPTLDAQLCAELRAEPTRWRSLSYHISCSERTVSGTTELDDHGFCFMLNWICMSPLARPRVSFRTYTLDDLLEGKAKRSLFETKLDVGQHVEFALDA